MRRRLLLYSLNITKSFWAALLGTSAALLGTSAGATGLASAAVIASVPASSRFHPLSVTFVSLDTGWALGTVPCKSAGACLSLVKTTDSGRDWTTQPSAHQAPGHR